MSDGLCVLVCGGRNYRDNNAVWDKLSALHAAKRIVEVIHGGAAGADGFGEEWAVANGIRHRAFKAEWDTYGRAAGPVRNRQMLDEGKPDIVVAFPGGAGTADMVRQAAGRGVIVEFCK